MKVKFVLMLSALMILTISVVGQNDLQIKQKMSMKIPGMPALPPGMGNPMKDRTSTVYIKGSRMRTDMQYEQRKITGKKENITQTYIVQCDKQRRYSFNSKKKSYYAEPMSGVSSSEVKNARSGGHVVMTGVVTDTGERAKLFGYNAKHLKQSYTITPGPNSCQKETFKIEMDGWYIDIPEYSCPMRRKPREFQMDSKCFDEVEYRMKGEVTGFPVKEIKTMTMQGMTMNIEEEAVELVKVPLAESLFEPPVGYKAANTLKEVEDDSEDAPGSFDPTVDTAPQSTGNTTLALPKGGVEKQGKVAKRPGVIRFGIVTPTVQLADKDSAEAASGVADAIAGLFEERLGKQNFEVVRLTSENGAKEAECDYIIQATIGQKHAGGGMLGMMLGMPQLGKMPKMPDPNQTQSQASMEMQAAIGASVKARDEFTFDFKVLGLDRSIAFQKTGKVKTSYHGEDPLSLPIREASDGILAKFASGNK